MERKNKEESLNLFIVVILLLVILRHVFLILQNAMILSMISDGYTRYAIWYTLSVSVFMIIVLIATINKRKWGVIGFFVLQFINIFGINVVSGGTGNFGVDFLTSCLMAGLFGVLLLLRNNGKSAWKAIFQDNGQKKQSCKIQMKLQNWFKRHKPVNNIGTQKVVLENGDGLNDTVSDKEREHKPTSKKHGMRLFCVVLLSFAIMAIGGAAFYIYEHFSNSEYLMNRADMKFKKGEIKKAIEIYENLAEDRDYVPAKTRLGILFLDNDSVPLDSVKGKRYIEEAAYTDTVALKKTILLYAGHSFKGMKFENYDKCKYYCQLAIDRHVLQGLAYCALGNIAAYKEDYGTALYYWQKSSKFGYALAYGNMGWMAYNGKGCEPDLPKAYRYFQKALEIDNEDAYVLKYMGIFYQYGDVVEKNELLAMDYFEKAANLGDDEAKALYAELLEKYPCRELEAIFKK